MVKMVWGLLGRESLGPVRRTRTLGLGAAVRNFNELAVPGIGGVWFCRQIFLSTLGVAVNELARQAGSRTSNIEVANALEALGCWHALARSGHARDERIKGRDTLPHTLADSSFANISRPSFYITQPMRMQTVQSLLALGLVKSLQNWVCGSERTVNTDTICDLLSPVEPLPLPAREQLRHLLVDGATEDAARRRNLLAWMEDLRQGKTTPHDQPAQLSATHWHEVQAGRLFFQLQSAALALLETIEAMLVPLTPREIAPNSLIQAPVLMALADLRKAAASYLEHGYADQHGTGADLFALSCRESNDARLIEKLINLDERVLRMQGGFVVPGAAFSDNARLAQSEREAERLQPEATAMVPPDLSYRISNFYLLNLDLNGALDTSLASQEDQSNG